MIDPVFKVCTRPALLFSVPMLPLLLVTGSILLVTVWGSLFDQGLWSALLIVPAYIVMRGITRYDDAMFSLLWLKFKCRASNYNAGFYKASVYSPIAFKKNEAPNAEKQIRQGH